MRPAGRVLDPAVFVELIESGAGVRLGASTIANCYLPSRVHQVTRCERLEGNMINSGASHRGN
jgi:phage terminase large subunit-like protein